MSDTKRLKVPSFSKYWWNWTFWATEPPPLCNTARGPQWLKYMTDFISNPSHFLLWQSCWTKHFICTNLRVSPRYKPSGSVIHLFFVTLLRLPFDQMPFTVRAECVCVSEITLNTKTAKQYNLFWFIINLNVTFHTKYIVLIEALSIHFR